MSHYTPMHARDGQRQDALRARARDTWTRAVTDLITWSAWYRRCEAKVRLIPLIPMIVRRARTRAAGSPAPAEAPVQEKPRPGDHQRRASAARSGPGQPQAPGAVAAGTGTSAGGPRPPAAAAEAVPPSAGAAAPLPRPVPGPPAGRAGAARPAWVIFPDDRAALMQAGQVSINGLHARHRPPATEPIRISVVRPYYPAAEARRDSVARWGA